MIYHYCVIVEMFCIGLYARHTFRKVEPSLEVVEGPVGARQTDRAVQTDSHMTRNKPQLLAEEARPGRRLSGASNLAFFGAGEDALCRIEHEPLDGFSFPRAKREATKPSGAEEAGLDLTHMGVGAEMTRQNSGDVTVV